jgi:hypothetical protein
MRRKKINAASGADDETPEWTRKDFERAQLALSSLAKSSAPTLLRRSRGDATVREGPIETASVIGRRPKADAAIQGS